MISVVIPAYNEAACIQLTIGRARQLDDSGLIKQIIVADGGSTDNTPFIAESLGAMVVHCHKRGRAAQMNEGASRANQEIVYFLHADSIPPGNFTGHILAALQNNAIGGCFRLAFDVDHWFLKANCWFTRFNVNAVRFGDQSLFLKRSIFHAIGGFKDNLILMEDQEIIHRIKKHGKFMVMSADIITSARKYKKNGPYRMQGIFLLIWILYYLGFSQQFLHKIHRKLIKT